MRRPGHVIYRNRVSRAGRPNLIFTDSPVNYSNFDIYRQTEFVLKCRVS